MAKPVTEVLVTVLNFSGAAILCIDALRMKRSTKEKLGAEKLVRYFKAIGKGDLVSDEHGNAFDSEAAIEEWLASRTQRFAWLGLVLLALGFLLDLIIKMTAPS